LTYFGFFIPSLRNFGDKKVAGSPGTWGLRRVEDPFFDAPGFPAIHVKRPPKGAKMHLKAI
jgi:hypothetical protein